MQIKYFLINILRPFRGITQVQNIGNLTSKSDILTYIFTLMFLTLLRAKLLNNETITEILNIFQNAFLIIISKITFLNTKR